tara:strand:+ start:432 stop:866 length:435 start_codon:yes stop_codon:yes gene_type:complete
MENKIVEEFESWSVQEEFQMFSGLLTYKDLVEINNYIYTYYKPIATECEEVEYNYTCNGVRLPVHESKREDLLLKIEEYLGLLETIFLVDRTNTEQDEQDLISYIRFTESQSNYRREEHRKDLGLDREWTELDSEIADRLKQER